MKNKNLITILILLILMLVLASCKSMPTEDPALVITSVAQTVIADLTKTALAKPTNTPTRLPTATNTPQPTEDAAAETPIAATETAETELAPTTPAQTGTDAGVWVSSNPPDNSDVLAGDPFTVSVRLMNTGSSTWTTAYAIAYGSGKQMGAPDDINLPYDVPPGTSVDLDVTFTAPTTEGTVRSDWFLVNAAGINFYTFYFEYEVVPKP